MATLWGVPVELLIGPASGLIISLIFAGVFYSLFMFMLGRHKETVDLLIKAFEEEIAGCNVRYDMVFKELLRMKEKI